MSDVTRILSAIEQGDQRRLATTRLVNEKPGQLPLVHDAYLRLVDVGQVQHWSSRGHFLGTLAEAMRRILVEQARRKNSKLFSMHAHWHEPLFESNLVRKLNKKSPRPNACRVQRSEFQQNGNLPFRKEMLKSL